MTDKYVQFDVTFNALIDYRAKDVTSEENCEAVFAQSSIFVESILTAIYLLNLETQSIGKDALRIIRTSETLAFIGLAFNEEARAQFYEMHGITEATKDDLSKEK